MAASTESLSRASAVPATGISFHPVSEFPGWTRAPQFLRQVISQYECKDVLELGCGANPTLSRDDVGAMDVRYTANDVSAEELDKADAIFERWVCDMSKGSVPESQRGTHDVVFSRMVNEHVADGRTYHANIRDLLKPGGIAVHCFSTLYSLPFLINRIAPGFLSAILLRVFHPRDAHQFGKFRAYYSWSRGPSPRMVKRFESLGYQVISYRGYFGHMYYAGIPPLQRLEFLKAKMLVKNPVAALCSYGMVILRKP